MRRRKRFLGSVLGMALSLTFFSTQVFAAENVSGISFFSSEDEIVLGTSGNDYELGSDLLILGESEDTAVGTGMDEGANYETSAAEDATGTNYAALDATGGSYAGEDAADEAFGTNDVITEAAAEQGTATDEVGPITSGDPAADSIIISGTDGSYSATYSGTEGEVLTETQDGETVVVVGAAQEEILEYSETTEKTYDNGPDGLPYATDVQWLRPGQLGFIIPSADYYYTVTVQNPQGRNSKWAGRQGEAGTMYTINCSELFIEEGTYKLSVKTTTSSEDFDIESGTVTGWEETTYVRPAQMYDTPTNLRWSSTTAMWDDVGAEYYEVQLIENGTITAWYPHITGTSHNFYKSTGRLSFRVMAYSSDPTQTAASSWSEESPVLDLDGGSDIPQDGEIPKVTELGFDCAGSVYFTMPKAGYYYCSIIVDPDETYHWYLYQRCNQDGEINLVYRPELFTKSGTYKLQVLTSRTDGNQARDGVYSDFVEYNYVRPSDAYAAPTNLRWGSDGTANWDPVQDDVTYYVQFYKDSKPFLGSSTKYTSYKPYNENVDAQWTFSVYAYGDNPDEKASSEVIYSAPYGGSSAPTTNGLGQSDDGNWYLYENGQINTSYSGLYEDANLGWWLIDNGRVAKEFNDLYCDSRVGWWKIKDGAVDFGYTDLYESPAYGWWKINGGSVEFGYSDLYESPAYGFWKIFEGSVDFGFTGDFDSPIYGLRHVENGQVVGSPSDEPIDPHNPEVQDINGLAPDDSGAWYLYDHGRINTSYNGLYNDANVGWWLVLDGRVAFEYNDLYFDEYCGWWLISNGAVNFGYNDLFGSPVYGWWVITGGSVNFAYSDIYDSPTVGMWVIDNGQVDFGYNGVYDSPTMGSWRVEGGSAKEPAQADDPAVSDFTGLAPDESGTWYLYDHGRIDTSFSGLYNDANVGWWLVLNGRVAFEYSELYCDANFGWWLVLEGRVAFEYNDLYNSPSCGWWKITNGSVDFNYNDLYLSPTCGWWLISGGAVNFGYTDLYGSPTVGWWLVSGGTVNFAYDDVFASPGLGYWKVAGGAVDFGYNGIFNSQIYGTCYISGGKAELRNAS